MQVVLIKVSAATRRQNQQVQADTSKAKRFMCWFIVAFALSEVIILSTKGFIYLSKREWWSDQHIDAIQIVFFVLHILRLVFPITLIVKLTQEVRLYLSLVSQHISKRRRQVTKIVTGVVVGIGLTQALWYNIVIQYYYIIYLNALPPASIDDQYFSIVYYLTTMFNELNFCLFLGIALVVLSFTKARLRKIATNQG